MGNLIHRWWYSVCGWRVQRFYGRVLYHGLNSRSGFFPIFGGIGSSIVSLRITSYHLRTWPSVVILDFRISIDVCGNVGIIVLIGLAL